MSALFFVVAVLFIVCALWLWQVSRARIAKVAVATEEKTIDVLSSLREQPLAEFAASEAEEEDEGQDRAPFMQAEGVWKRDAARQTQQGGTRRSLPGRPHPIAAATQTITCTGEAALPNRVYAGDSQDITLRLQVISRLQAAALPEHFRINEVEQGKRLHVRVQALEPGETRLEVELLAAGVATDGEKCQQQTLAANTLVYRWSCYFANPGNQTLTLVLRAVHHSSKQELGVLHKQVKVTRLAHLSQRQVEVFTALSGVASFFATVLGIAVILHWV